MYGGADQVLHLIEGLAAHGVDGTLVCARGSQVAAAAQSRGLRALAVPMGGDLDPGFGVRLWRAIRRIEPSLVHVHSRRGADRTGGMAAALAGVPAVLSRRVDRPESLWGRQKYRFYARVIAISGCIFRQLLDAGVPAQKLRQVASGVPPAGPTPAWSREKFLAEFNLDEDDFVIAVIAQLIPRKGHRHLLAALPGIVAAGVGARVILFGAGALEPQLRAQVEQQRLGDVVRFAGYRPDLADFLGHVQVLAHPATREGLGVSLLEAQAAGVPVVGFRAGGIIEAVDDGVTGTLVAPGDGGQLEAAITYLAYHPQERERMGEAARAWVAANFSVDAMVRGNLAVYREIIDAANE